MIDSYKESLDNLLSNIEPEEVPSWLIMFAKVTTQDGEVLMLTADEYEDFHNEYHDDIIETRIVIDMVLAAKIIEEATYKILKNIA